MVGILRTAAVLDHAVNEALKPHGLTGTQHNVLRILRGAGDAGLCGREVGERLIARVPDVSRLLDRLVETGLVARERSLDDRRHVTARITDAGRRMLDEVEPVIDEIEERFLGGLAPDALTELIAALGAHHHTRTTPYASNASSFDTSARRSTRACAMSIRSNGSLGGPGNAPAA
jgi:DNA-binding MarR family transcriptional regulator